VSTLVLASASPRRLDLLRTIGLDPVVRPVDADEAPLPGEGAIDHVTRLAEMKARAGGGPGAAEVVLAADTIVALDGVLLGKPADADEARRTLRSLSGRSHEVHTGVTVRSTTGAWTTVVTTAVRFRDLTDAEIDWYVRTGEPLDKAGAYGIQGAAAVFVTSIDGSASNVIGLPLAETAALLRAAGLTVAGA
jgi:septum formation protein